LDPVIVRSEIARLIEIEVHDVASPAFPLRITYS
jgi:hypothetical protein